MKQQSRWEKCRIKCPEEKVEAELLVEWRQKEGRLVANSVSCNNPKLMDLKPADCQWTCWEEIEKKQSSPKGHAHGAKGRRGGDNGRKDEDRAPGYKKKRK